MKILIACEFSGVVRDAFLAEGHDAWSCDLIDSYSPGPHYKADVLTILDKNWDMLIAHPPCTFLANSGVSWLYGGKGTAKIDPSRWEKMEKGAEFFLKLKNYSIQKIAIENPVPHKFAKKIIGPYSQIIYPWQFGYRTTKPACLWLNNLPKLKSTDWIDPSTGVWSEHNEIKSKGEARQRERSITLKGIAKAMAMQWGVVR